MLDYENYSAAAEFIKSKLGRVPRTALVLGSGLGFIREELESCTKIHYADIPGFPVSTNPSHEGCIYSGRLVGVDLLVFSGRVHCYEGYTMEETAFYATVLGLLGVENLIITNSAGGINKSYNVGDIMIITDHIKLTALSPVSGQYDPRLGKKFCDMTRAYSPKLIRLAESAARSRCIPLHKGIYFYCAGPQYETPAEIKAFRILGADAVGMSTVPEVIAAAKSGINVLGFSLITNMAAGITGDVLDDSDVVATAARSGKNLAAVIEDVITQI